MALGADEAIMLDTAGHVSEASASNIFVVAGGRVHTPPASCGILPGITRRVVLEILARLGPQVSEEPFGPELFAAADEVFLTSSVREIVAVTRINSTPFSRAGSGPVTNRVAAAYAARVRSEVDDGRASP